MKALLPYGEALDRLRRIAASQGPLSEQSAALDDALGRVTSASVASVDALPRFDNSSMDGYAVAAGRTAGATDAKPVRLRVLGSITAGDAPVCSPRAEGAWEIMTGAPMPAGCDAVVPVERTERAKDEVLVREAAEPGQFVRRVGEDFAAGVEVFPAGRRLDARDLLALAALGVARVTVKRKPKVVLISTGRELVEPGGRCSPGQIHNGTATYLRAALPGLGAEVVSLGTVADKPAAFAKKLAQALKEKPDLVLCTGAVSAGRHDFVPDAAVAAGAVPVFHGLAVRPGKPVFAARWMDGPLFVGLPGNPVSTVVGLRFLVGPYLRERLGLPPEMPWRATLPGLPDDLPALRCFLKGQVDSDGRISVLDGQASFQIQPLVRANAWIVVPEGGDRTALEIFPLEPDAAAWPVLPGVPA